MKEEEVSAKVEHLINNASARWESCHRSFVRLFAVLNKNIKISKDTFDIVASNEIINSLSVETRIRLEREKDNSAFVIRPYTIIGERIVDQMLGKEVFCDEYYYSFGTHNNQIARVSVKFDGNSTDLFLSRLNGYPVNEMTTHNTAVLLASLDDVVFPELEKTEDSLILLWDIVTDPNLNPHYANSL